MGGASRRERERGDDWQLGREQGARAKHDTVEAQLGGVGFTRSEAKGDGDCYPLGVMAGFEITAEEACQPTADTTTMVRQAREGSNGSRVRGAVLWCVDQVHHTKPQRAQHCSRVRGV